MFLKRRIQQNHIAPESVNMDPHKIDQHSTCSFGHRSVGAKTSALVPVPEVLATGIQMHLLNTRMTNKSTSVLTDAATALHIGNERRLMHEKLPLNHCK